MKALFTCWHYWNSPFHMGLHEIAKNLLNRDCEIAFISNPISPPYILTGLSDELKARFKNYRSGGEKYANLFTYVPGGLLTPARRPLLDSVWLLKNWHKLTFPNLKSKLTKEGFGDVDFIYLDSLYFNFLPSLIKHKRTIVQIADRLDGFSNYLTAMDTVSRETVSKADLVIYTAANLRQYVENLGAKTTLHLPNGVNFGHFDVTQAALPAEFAAIPPPRVIYVGAIEQWFDHEAVTFLAKSLPNVSFVLIGNDEHIPSGEKNLPNVYTLGKKPYETIPSYLYHSDVGIIPFDVTGHKLLIDSVNPLKMYEYMASGLPVVSASWKELETIDPPAYLYNDYPEALDLVKRALQEGKSRRQEYKNYAKSFDWSHKVDEILVAVRL